MKYSIITVTRNCADTIERTIKSVLTQDYAAFEYIVIDGASTDGTAQIIEGFKEKLTFYVSEPDSGMYEAMNKGLKHATGDLVLFLNGDDYLIDDTALTRMSRHFVDDETVVIGRLYAGDTLSPDNSHATFKSKYYGIFYPHQATFVPKGLFEKLGGFDESYKVSADFEWICRAMYKGYCVKWVDEIVSYFSLGGMSSTLQCLIDEYNISFKYMKLTNDPLLEDMTSKSKTAMKRYLFKMICENDEYFEVFSKAITELWGTDEGPLQVWGAGFWGRIIVRLLQRCGYTVDLIFDSSGKIDFLENIPVHPFNAADVKRVIVSTENYDMEISNKLENMGFSNKSEYISFQALRDIVLSKLDESNEELRSFARQTGLSIW